MRGRAARTGQGNEVVGSTLTFEVSSSQLSAPPLLSKQPLLLRLLQRG